jgi:hypothetical protein
MREADLAISEVHLALKVALAEFEHKKPVKLEAAE